MNKEKKGEGEKRNRNASQVTITPVTRRNFEFLEGGRAARGGRGAEDVRGERGERRGEEKR